MDKDFLINASNDDTEYFKQSMKILRRAVDEAVDSLDNIPYTNTSVLVMVTVKLPDLVMQLASLNSELSKGGDVLEELKDEAEFIAESIEKASEYLGGCMEELDRRVPHEGGEDVVQEKN